MKQVLLMAVLAAGMLLAGCSKDSEETANRDMEKQELLNNMKEHIVGTWKHDGDAYFKDISDLGTIENGIIHDCKAEFGAYVPATIVFNSDGTLHLTVDQRDPWGVNCGGTYEIMDERNGAVGFFPHYDKNYYEAGRYHFFYFRFMLMFFDNDYKTLYFISESNGIPNVGRYRRVL